MKNSKLKRSNTESSLDHILKDLTGFTVWGKHLLPQNLVFHEKNFQFTVFANTFFQLYKDSKTHYVCLCSYPSMPEKAGSEDKREREREKKQKQNKNRGLLG